jgi:hypothetical protein
MPVPISLVLVGTNAPHGLDDDVRHAFGCLIRQEEHGAGDGHHVRVRAGLERCALFVRQSSVALFGMHDPDRYGGPAEAVALFGFIFTFIGGPVWTFDAAAAFAILRLWTTNAPTRSGLLRDQDALNAQACGRSLIQAIRSTPPPPRTRR